MDLKKRDTPLTPRAAQYLDHLGEQCTSLTLQVLQVGRCTCLDLVGLIKVCMKIILKDGNTDFSIRWTVQPDSSLQHTLNLQLSEVNSLYEIVITDGEYKVC